MAFHLIETGSLGQKLHTTSTAKKKKKRKKGGDSRSQKWMHTARKCSAMPRRTSRMSKRDADKGSLSRNAGRLSSFVSARAVVGRRNLKALPSLSFPHPPFPSPTGLITVATRRSFFSDK
ncbi:hypothetical protein PUN28_013332 [Cardiocondyla obscurior]|uniref:Uncharacterized protein n=1 Tax=Cardiocondyla obscurior TaxID=286306 RepID=A0AAW2F978_9HYME